ncbi:hypothetical protein [Paenibacillus thiaminolyticus]|uniref:hypothetical protein n=1 Tax=Paenibacillus thiaminolyticus TaxID=49283 RepID=UPI001F0EA73C|nr:hypothetical protein [Paenibacillus thiaminolyticus]
MSKFVQTDYGNKKQILKFPDHYVNVAITVDNVGVTANSDGKKIVPAGTIMGGGVLADPSVLAKKSNDENAEGGALQRRGRNTWPCFWCPTDSRLH